MTKDTDNNAMNYSVFYEPYDAPRLVSFFHDLPRFGRPSDFSLISSEDRRMEYTSGVVIFAITIIIIYVALAVIILTIAYMKPERMAGCYKAENDSESRYSNVRHERFRQVAFATCCAIVIASFSVVFIFDGVVIAKTRRDMRSTVSYVNELDLLWNQTYCPLNTTAGWEDYMRLLAQILVDVCQIDPSNNFTETVAEMRTWLDDMYSTLSSGTLAMMIVAFILSGLIAVFFICFVSFYYFPDKCVKRVKCSGEKKTGWIVAFVIVSFFSWILIAGVAAAALVNADFCSGTQPPYGPGGTLLDILDVRGIPNWTQLYLDTDYLVKGCPGPFPIASKLNMSLAPDINRGVDPISDMFYLDLSWRDIICDKLDPEDGGFNYIIDFLNKQFCAHYRFLDVTCTHGYPMYRSLVFNAACTDMPLALIVSFGLFFIMAFFSAVSLLIYLIYWKMQQFEKNRANDENTDELEAGSQSCDMAVSVQDNDCLSNAQESIPNDGVSLGIETSTSASIPERCSDGEVSKSNETSIVDVLLTAEKSWQENGANNRE